MTFKFYKVVWRHYLAEVGRFTLAYFVTNLFGILCTNFYQNRPSFVQDLTKTFWLTFFLAHGVVIKYVRAPYMSTVTTPLKQLDA